MRFTTKAKPVTRAAPVSEERIVAEPAIAFHTDYRQAFEQICSHRQEPDFINHLRERSLARYESLGFPTRRQEQWRATDLSTLAATHFTRADDTPIDTDRLPQPFISETNSLRLVFINGRYAAGLSQLTELPDGVIVTNLANAIEQYPEQLEQYLDQTYGLDDHPFNALNSALMEDGVFISLAPGKVLETLVHLVFYGNGDGIAHYPRNLIVLGQAAELSVIEDYRGSGHYFTCPITEIKLADGAICRYHKLQQESANAYHLGGSRFQQDSNSNLDAHFISAGGALNRNDIITQLDGSGAHCSLHGLALVNDGQLGDFHVCVEHKQPHCTSQQMFKNIVDGKSRAVFDGLIRVVKDAQKTDAQQNSRNLLLSKRAIANANPRLEILADDVSCSHGSTTGFLDEDALFYLRSRGIGEAQARALLVYGFAHEQIEAIQLPPLRKV